MRLLSPCYLPDTSLLSANNLPVLFPFRARRFAAPYFDNHLKRNTILTANEAKTAPGTGRKGALSARNREN